MQAWTDSQETRVDQLMKQVEIVGTVRAIAAGYKLIEDALRGMSPTFEPDRFNLRELKALRELKNELETIETEVVA